MPSRDDVRVRIAADTKGLSSGLKGADKLVSNFATGAKRSLRSFAEGFTRPITSLFSFQGAIATLIGAGGIGLLVKSSLEAADGIAKTADKVGLGIEALQEYRYAASLAGVAQGTFDMAMQRFSRRVGEAVQGQGELKDTLALYNIQLRDSEGRTRSLESILDDYADAIKNAASNQEQLRLAFKGFDSEGAALVNLFRDGADGVARLRQEAREMGVVLDTVMVREAEQAGDQMARVGTILRTNVTRAVLSLTPTIVRLSDVIINKLIPAASEFASKWAPDWAVGLETLTARLRETEAEIQNLAGVSAKYLLAVGLPDLSVFGDNAEKIRALLVRLRDLSEAVDEAARKEALYKAAIDGTGGATDVLGGKIRTLAGDLQFEIDQLGRGEAEQRLYAEAKKLGTDVTDSFRAAIGPLVSKLAEEKAAMEAAKTAAKEHEKALADLKSQAETVFENTRTPLEKYRIELLRLNALVLQGAIDWETYRRAVAKAQDELDKVDAKGKDTKRIFDNVSVSLSSGFADAVIEGRKFSEVLQGLASDVAKLIIQTQLLNAIKAGASALGFNVASADGNVFHRGHVVPFARGGILTAPTAFPLAGGRTGIAGEAGPEAVMPLTRGAGGRLGVSQAAAQVTVNIMTPPGTQAQSRERDNGRGGKTIDVMISEMVARGVGDRGNPINRALRQGFGLTPSTVGR